MNPNLASILMGAMSGTPLLPSRQAPQKDQYGYPLPVPAPPQPQRQVQRPQGFADPLPVPVAKPEVPQQVGLEQLLGKFAPQVNAMFAGKVQDIREPTRMISNIGNVETANLVTRLLAQQPPFSTNPDQHVMSNLLNSIETTPEYPDAYVADTKDALLAELYYALGGLPPEDYPPEPEMQMLPAAHPWARMNNGAYRALDKITNPPLPFPASKPRGSDYDRR